MNVIKGYYILNMKILFKDKISFIWSILLPSAFIYFNISYLQDILDVRFYWSYIIFTSYVFGIGLHTLNLRERGRLKTYFSIKDSRLELFIANILTQITFCFISIFILNIFIHFIAGFNIVLMFLFSSILIITALPIAFLFFSITLIKRIHYNSIHTIITMVTTIFLIVMGLDSTLNRINPITYISNILMIRTANDLVIYIVFSIIFVSIGTYSIKNFSAISNEVR